MTEIMELLGYQFMQRAIIVGILLAITLPCIGLSVVLKRLSMIGDTLAHSSLAGVSIGLVLGFNPLLGSICICVFAGLSIEFIRNKLKAYQEISTVIILAASIGVAGILSDFMYNSNTISSYLFGSILTIGDDEFYLVIAVSTLVLITYKVIYNKLYLTVFDSNAASLIGINVKAVNFLFTILSAITISISAKTIGSLIVSSLLVIPVITAMQFAKTYQKTLILAMIFSVIFVLSGLSLSYFYDLKSGSVIVLIAVATLIVSLFIRRKE